MRNKILMLRVSKGKDREFIHIGQFVSGGKVPNRKSDLEIFFIHVKYSWIFRFVFVFLNYFYSCVPKNTVFVEFWNIEADYL